MKKSVNILGATYKILYKNEPWIIPNISETTVGSCDSANKVITLLTTADYHTLLHEITHAYLYESGLLNYSGDECLVEWIARNCEKICIAYGKWIPSSKAIDISGRCYKLINTNNDSCEILNYRSEIKVPKNAASTSRTYIIILGWLWESGLDLYSEDETLLNWLVATIPKIVMSGE